MSTTQLRDATPDDLPAINDIYNHYVLHSTCTYQLEPETLDDRGVVRGARRKVSGRGGRDRRPHRGLGIDLKFHARAGYDPSVEASVYIDAGFHRRGLGRTLLEHLIERARAAGFHTIIGGASAEQTASIALQEGLGFTRVAQFKEVGQKFGQRLDVIYLQLML